MKLINTIKRIFSQNDLHNENEQHIFSESWFSNLLLAAGSINIFFVFSLFTLSSIGFLLGYSLTDLHISLSLGATLLFIYIAAKVFYHHHIPYFLILLMSFLSSLLISLVFAAQFYDLSYDGQWYHLDIVMALSDGWNPVYTHLNSSYVPTADLLNAYPKMAEITQTALYEFTGKIELSKMFNLFWMITAFFMSAALLLKIKFFNPFSALISALLINLNPVAICQLISFYIDGQVYALMISVLSLLGIMYFSNRKFLFIPLISLITLVVNIKLTAILFTLLFLTLLLAYYWNYEKIKKLIITASIAFIAFGLSTVLIGFNPYVTNTFWYHHPLYPAAGKGATDYVKVNAPENFYGKDSLSLLFYSIFSESAFLKGDGKRAELKPPFTFSREEVEIFTSTDPIEGGFGPLFSGIFIISILIFIIGIKSGHRNEIRLLYIIGGIVFLSSIIVAASFYARFIPQFWLIPSLAFLMAIVINSKISNALAYILFALLVMNLTMITYINFTYNIQRTALMKQELSDLRELTINQKPLINFGDFRSNKLRFTEAGINFESTQSELNCAPKVRLLEDLIQESKVLACNLQINK